MDVRVDQGLLMIALDDYDPPADFESVLLRLPPACGMILDAYPVCFRFHSNTI